jgi:hypothetical protein
MGYEEWKQLAAKLSAYPFMSRTAELARNVVADYEAGRDPSGSIAAFGQHQQAVDQRGDTRDLVGTLALGGITGAGLFGGAGAATGAAAEGAAAAGGTAAATEGAALGTGLTAGTTGATLAPGMGLELGTGLTAGATGAAGITSAGAAGTALAPGFFAAESLYPVVGAAAGGAAATGAASSAGSTAAGRILSGEGSLEDFLRLGGQALPGLIGAYASDQQSDALRRLSEQYMALGAPSRARYESSFAPGFSMASDPGYKDMLDATTKSFLHKASVGGNPVDSPNAWKQTLSDVNANFAYPALQDYRRVNAGTGGLAALTSAAPATATGSIAAQGNVYNSLGGMTADIFSPPRSLEDVLKGLKGLI